MIQDIHEAYEVLSDERNRKSYDLKRRHRGRTSALVLIEFLKIISFSVDREIDSSEDPII